MIASFALISKVIDSSSSEDLSDTSSDEELLFIIEKKREQHIKIKDFFTSIIPRYSDMDFRSHFRLTRVIVQKFLQDLDLHFINSYVTKPPLSPEHALLLTLWVLANQESFRSVADRFGLSRGHAHAAFIKTLQAIYNVRRRYIIWPQHELRKTALSFSELRGNSSFPNVVGCVDGTHILIPAPKDDNSYYNRKGTHSMLVQGICNAEMVFTDIYCGWPGSTHDSRMWKESPIYQKLRNNLLNEQFHLLGDTAYPLETFIMVPYKDNGHLTQRQKKFNTILSSTRVIIEQAFGRLKVMSTCVLHNLCIREGIECVDIESCLDEDLNNDIDNSVGMRIQATNARAKNKRDSIAAEIEKF